MSECKELSFPVPWGQICAKAWGDPCLQPVLMVHGIQDNAGSFDRLIPLLPKIFYYVCVDLPGHGLSSRYPKGMHLDLMTYVMSLHRLVKQLGWGRFIYIGHSLGGQLGTYYSVIYPHTVTKLVSIDAISPRTVSGQDFLKYYRTMSEKLLTLEEKLLEKGPPSYTYEAALDRMVTNRPSSLTKEAAQALLKRGLKQNDQGYYYANDQRLKFHVVTPITPEQHALHMSLIDCPFLLVASELYLTFIKNQIRGGIDEKVLSCWQKKANFQLEVVDGSHDVHNNEPSKVAPSITQFLLREKSSL